MRSRAAGSARPSRRFSAVEDLVGVPLPGLGQGDQDLTAVSRVDVATDPALLFQPGHTVGDRARGDLGATQQRPGAEPLPGRAAQAQQHLELPDLDALGRQLAAQLTLHVIGQPAYPHAQLLGGRVQTIVMDLLAEQVTRTSARSRTPWGGVLVSRAISAVIPSL